MWHVILRFAMNDFDTPCSMKHLDIRILYSNSRSLGHCTSLLFLEGIVLTHSRFSDVGAGRLHGLTRNRALEFASKGGSVVVAEGAIVTIKFLFL